MRLFVTCFFLSILLKINAQVNLVPNPSFEDTINCPTGISQLYNCAQWLNPNFAGPDYFNSCANYSTFVSVPENSFGYQTPVSGNAYVGLLLYQRSTSGGPYDYREYIQVQLLDTLKSGKSYCVSFHVNHSSMGDIAIDNIGMYLSNTAVNNSSPTVLMYTPQVVSPPGFFIQDTMSWYKVEGIYVATGGEKYITIGNFNDEFNTDTIHTASFTYAGYYFIDDVSVIDCNDTANEVLEIKSKLSFNVFPNPNNGNMTLDYALAANEKGKMIICDVTGKIISQYELNNTSNKLVISNEQLNNGVYFYYIILNNKVVQSILK
jgi:hypothetical protein